MDRIFFMLMISLTFQLSGQNSIQKYDQSIADRLYLKCFPNLNQGSELFEQYPAMKKMGYCSIMQCIVLLAYEEEFVQEIGKARLRGIATQLFREGNPVILISGMDSSSTVFEENENIQDDDNIIYISVGECVIPSYVWKASEVFNEQTKKLIDKKRDGS